MDRVGGRLKSFECGIIFGGIPNGAISRKVGLIWGIPDKSLPELIGGLELLLIRTEGSGDCCLTPINDVNWLRFFYN